MTTYLTPAQDAEFDAQVQKWQAILGLNDWRIERGAKRGSKDAMAQVNVKIGARLAVYKTGNWGEQVPDPESIEATALHELLHVFLADFAHAVKTSDNDLTLESVEHAVVNRLEKLLLKGAR